MGVVERCLEDIRDDGWVKQARFESQSTAYMEGLGVVHHLCCCSGSVLPGPAYGGGGGHGFSLSGSSDSRSKDFTTERSLLA